MSATTFTEVDAPNGTFVEKFRVDAQHHLDFTRGSYFGQEYRVPLNQNYPVRDVKAVLDVNNNVECFFNGMDGHLWEITHYRAGNWSTVADFHKNFYAFDAAADGTHVEVAGIDSNHVLWQIEENVGHGWNRYINPGGTSARFLDVALWAEGGYHGQAPGRATNPLDIYVVAQDHHVWWDRETVSRPKSWTQVPGGYFDHVDAVQESPVGGLPFIRAWQGSDGSHPLQNWLNFSHKWQGWEY